MDEQEMGVECESGALKVDRWSERAPVERRSGLDQRSPGGARRSARKGLERREGRAERRREEERREGWLRVDHWRSVSVFDEAAAPQERKAAAPAKARTRPAAKKAQRTPAHPEERPDAEGGAAGRRMDPHAERR